MDCDARAIKQGRCDAHWQAYRQRPGVRAKQRRRDAIRMGQDAAAQLRRRMKDDFRKGVRTACAICTAEPFPSAMDVDHIVPLSRGGEDVASNVRALCRSCHRAVTRKEFYPATVPF